MRVFFYTFGFEMEMITNLLEHTVNYLRPAEIWTRVFSNKELQNTIIVEYIQQDQLFEKGVDESGEVIGYYSSVTENVYNPMKKAGEHYTLLDTGDFYRSMVFVFGKDFFEIDADPIKENDNLFEKYGEGIIGLTDESKEKLRLELLQRYEAEVRSILFGY